MRSLPLFIAIKYLKGKRTGFQSFVSSAGLIGVALGVAVLILVSSVMNGFERELRERILQAIPHASIEGGIDINQVLSVKAVLEENPEVLASSPYIETQGLISSANSLKGIYIFGVNPVLEKKVSIVSTKIISGSWNSIEEEKYGIIIGDILAFQLGIGVGDMVNILVPDTTLSLAGILPRTKRFKVTGIFRIGAPEMDQSFAYINITNAQKLLRMSNSVHGIRIKYQDLFQARQLVYQDTYRINEVLGTQFSSSNWTNSYGTLFQAIKMEKFLVFLLLSLVVVVAVFNIVSLSVMTINEKRTQIAILMTLGASRSFIQRIFIYFGSLIGLAGTCLGLIIGLVLTYFLGPIINFIEDLLDIRFLEVYFINYFPTDFRLIWIVIICLTALFLTVISSFYPSRLASKINPAEVLRYE
ncbi:MAG: lipoprotein-releasing ABC transporter permease subunit [SAR86 cluster bacterium]|jgi:lipoprotein-releasing system permease protein|nr:lipoprotein-releasing ABC transporter permease subunit [SAR86 cluster bacterium]